MLDEQLSRYFWPCSVCVVKQISLSLEMFWLSFYTVQVHAVRVRKQSNLQVRMLGLIRVNVVEKIMGMDYGWGMT